MTDISTSDSLIGAEKLVTEKGAARVKLRITQLKPEASLSRAAGYEGAEFAGWTPSLTPPDAEQMWGGRDLAVARARDLVRNEGLAYAAIDRKLDLAMGQQGLRFVADPDAQALGITEAEAETLGDEIERAFEGWANDPLNRADWEGTETWGGLCNLLARHFLQDGEGIGVLRWDDEPRFGGRYRTSLQVIDPDRLSNPNMAPDTQTMRAGVETDGREPIAYHFQNAHPYEYAVTSTGWSWERVNRAHDWGRPIVLHLRRKERAGEQRGWAAINATLAKFMGLSRYEGAEIQTNVLQSLLAAVIYTDRSQAATEDALGIDDVKKLSTYRKAYYGEKGMRLANGTRIATLFPSDRLEMLTANREGGEFEAFERVFLRHVASTLGLSYEQLTMDWSQVNYSSARGALVEVRRSTLAFLALFEHKIAQPVLLAVVEDAMDSGLITIPAGAPDLYEAPHAFLRGRWLGAPRGWIDPVKEATGAAIRLEHGLSTLRDEIAEQGGDHRANLRQRGREYRDFERLGIPLPKSLGEAAMAASLQPDPDSE